MKSGPRGDSNICKGTCLFLPQVWDPCDIFFFFLSSAHSAALLYVCPSYMSCTAQGEDISINTWTQHSLKGGMQKLHMHALSLSGGVSPALVFPPSPWMPHHTSQTKGGHSINVSWTHGADFPQQTLPGTEELLDRLTETFTKKKTQNTRVTAFWCQKWRKVYPQSGACSAATALILIHF